MSGTRCLGVRLSVVQRRKGQTAFDAADYQRLGRIYDGAAAAPKPRRARHFTEHRMFAPSDAPGWTSDADDVWRMAAEAETRYDANEARIITVTFPRSFASEAQLRQTVVAIADIFLEMNLVVQADLHVPLARDGLPNPHCHFLVSTRSISADGFHKKKCLALEKLCRARKGRVLRERLCEVINGLATEFGLPAQIHPESNYDLELEAVLEIRLPRHVFLSPETPANMVTLKNLDALRNRKNIPVLVAELQALEHQVAALHEELRRLRSEDVMLDPIPQMNTIEQPPAADPSIGMRYLRKIEEEYSKIRNEGGRRGRLAQNSPDRSRSRPPMPEAANPDGDMPPP